ncbi:MAG: 16S rRNA (cytidine(1402)-2'-O)-methyltransferase [Actinomycetota bacterium]|nr:16S rRNA (cytidine(1402)-2'-O)-methyltransferase [Actinomycetota bacterium]
MAVASEIPEIENESPIGRIVLAATPLGNVGDASARLIGLLETADVIAAEDTRRLRRLADGLGVILGGRVVSYYDANEKQRAVELVDAALAGAIVLVVTDAGMPSVSDPGYRVVAEAVQRGVPVTAAPGPSAVLMALAVSGLPVDRFCFEGFLPRKGGERQARIDELKSEVRTMVFFEAPHRLAAMLTALSAGLGPDRLAAVCRELTKTYEEVIRGTLESLVTWAADGVRGECTVVVSGASVDELRAARGLVTPQEWVAEVRRREEGGIERKSAIAEVAREVGVARREVYDAVIQSKAAQP